MPKFSIFTPMGHLRMSREPSDGERLFEVGRSSLGSAFPATRGTGRTFAWLYAWAMTLATARQFIRRGGEQWDPRRTWELLDVQEAERGAIPHAGQSVADRRAALTRARKLPVVPSRTNVANALAEVLGSRFVAYIPTPRAQVVNWPTALGSSPMLLRRPTDRRSLARSLTPIATVGSPVTISIEQWAAGVGHELQARDVVVLEPENLDRAETCSITATGSGTITLTPTKAHAAGVAVLLAPFPAWLSSRRHALVLLADGYGLDPEARRLVQATLEKMSRAVSTWDIGEANAGGASAGPFKVGVGKLGATPIGLVTL